jgi:hypothetical protein
MLFDVKKYKPAEAPPTGYAALVDASGQVFCESQKLIDVVNLVDHGRTVHYQSHGDWSMHQLLEKLLEKTGPAEVWISSYAFSETPARVIANLWPNVITRLNCVLDSRIDVRSASALTIIRSTACSFSLTHTHAKVTVIRNKEWTISVAGSANYTTNKRIEVGVISCDAVIASFHQKWIENAIRQQ